MRSTSKLSASKTRSKTSDFIKKTIQGAREMLSSIHQPRSAHDGRVYTQPRVDFDVSFEEVDFVIDPDLINLCRELSAKFQYSSDNLSGQPSFLSAMSCVSFQDLPMTNGSNVGFQMNKQSPTAFTEEKANAPVSHEIPRTSTFIVFPTESNQTNYPASTAESTGLPSSKAFLILQSDHAFRPESDKMGEIPASTTFVILQSEHTAPQEDAFSQNSFDQNVTVKLVNTNGVKTCGNKNECESKPPQKQMKPFRVFTFDTLPKSKTQIVSSKSCVCNGNPLNRSVFENAKENNNNHIKTVNDHNDAYSKSVNRNIVKDNIHIQNFAHENVLESHVNNTSNQDVRSRAHVRIARLGTTTHPEMSSIGGEDGGPTSRFEMVTVDPMFSSITKFDMVGSLQIIQRPVRGRSRNTFHSPEKKFGLYEYPMQTSHYEGNSETKKVPIKQNMEKNFSNCGVGRKTMLSDVEQSNCTLHNPSELSFSDTNESKKENKSKVDPKTEQSNRKEQVKNEEQGIKMKENNKLEQNNNKEQIIECTTETNTTKNKTISCPNTDEMYAAPSHAETNKSDESNKTVIVSEKSSKKYATPIHRPVTTLPNKRKGTASTNTSRSSVYRAVGEQSLSRKRNCKLSPCLTSSQAMYYAQLKNRADELKKRIRSKGEREYWYPQNDKINSARESTNSKNTDKHRDSKKNEIKDKIKKGLASAARKKEKDCNKHAAMYNAQIETANSYIVMSKNSYIRMKRTGKSKRDKTKIPLKMRSEKLLESEISKNVRSKAKQKSILRRGSEQKRRESEREQREYEKRQSESEKDQVLLPLEGTLFEPESRLSCWNL